MKKFIARAILVTFIITPLAVAVADVGWYFMLLSAGITVGVLSSIVALLWAVKNL